jgi:hypothetical protein
VRLFSGRRRRLEPKWHMGEIAFPTRSGRAAFGGSRRSVEAAGIEPAQGSSGGLSHLVSREDAERVGVRKERAQDVGRSVFVGPKRAAIIRWYVSPALILYSS